MAISHEQFGSPPGPQEMGRSVEVVVALSRASIIANQRKDRDTGLGHLIRALLFDARVGEILVDHGFSLNKADTALEKIRGRNLFRRYSKIPPKDSIELKNIVNRSALNHLAFTGGQGELTQLNLLDSIVNSDSEGIRWGRNSTPGFVNEGVKVLELSGIKVGELAKDVHARLMEHYKSTLAKPQI